MSRQLVNILGLTLRYIVLFKYEPVNAVVEIMAVCCDRLAKRVNTRRGKKCRVAECQGNW